ncbi:MAG: DUF2911 domain-containing protein [Bacteroidota bacterium]
MNTIPTVFLCFLLLSFSSCAQDKSNRPSPPAQISNTINGKKVTIDYSRPSKKGREIFGSLESFGKVWRTGANETTWIEFSDTVKVEGKTVLPGKYGLYTIPEPNQWTIIINEKWDEWGAYSYKQKKDVMRAIVIPQDLDEVVEQFTIEINETGIVSLAWDKTLVEFKVE